jgi:hypothetical protein
MKAFRMLAYAVVVLIGVYMILMFGNAQINPPMLSGVSFVLIGLAGISRK